MRTHKVYFWDFVEIKVSYLWNFVLTFLLLSLLPVSRVLKICWKLTSRKTIFHQIFRDLNLNSLLTLTEKYLKKIETIHIQWLHHNLLRWQILKGGGRDIPFINKWWVTSNMSYYWEPAGHHSPGLWLVSRWQFRPLIGWWPVTRDRPQRAHYTPSVCPATDGVDLI